MYQYWRILSGILIADFSLGIDPITMGENPVAEPRKNGCSKTLGKDRKVFSAKLPAQKTSYPDQPQTSVTRPKYPPPYLETSVAIPLSHYVSYGIVDYRCCTPTSFRKNGLLQSKDRPNKGASQRKLASEAYRAVGGVARNSIANRTLVGR